MLGTQRKRKGIHSSVFGLHCVCLLQLDSVEYYNLSKCPTAVSGNKLASPQKLALGESPSRWELSAIQYLVWLSSFSDEITFRHPSLGLSNSSIALLEFLRLLSLACRSSPTQRFQPWACGGDSWLSATQTSDPYKRSHFMRCQYCCG